MIKLIDASNEIKYFITHILNINIWNFRRLKQVVYKNIWKHGSQKFPTRIALSYLQVVYMKLPIWLRLDLVRTLHVSYHLK